MEDFFLWLIIGVVIGSVIGIWYAWHQGWAKREAKKILSVGLILNLRKFNEACDTLAKMTNDLEAIDLWKKLQTLKDELFEKAKSPH